MANLTGRGGFGDHPENINRDGAPKRDPMGWKATIKRITDMTRDEAIEYVGAKSKVGKLLKELPENMPIKDALVFISIIQFGRDPNPRMLSVLMDREEGRPQQAVDITSGGEPIAERVDDERFNRAISTFADAVREGLSGTGTGADGKVDTPE